MKNNRDYVESELDGDMRQLQTNRETMKKFRLTDPESARKLAEQVAKSKEKTGQFRNHRSI